MDASDMAAPNMGFTQREQRVLDEYTGSKQSTGPECEEGAGGERMAGTEGVGAWFR